MSCFRGLSQPSKNFSSASRKISVVPLACFWDST
nr:MAG TPA: hypothetical protein [Caudoviricetes sp.]